MTWAIAQETGSPSAKATLWSLSNYANDAYLTFVSQDKIAKESEQSIDSVQRRIKELADRGLVRRVKLRYRGRRTSDFIILRPSSLFAAGIEAIEPHLPRGCDIMFAAADAAADCGSVEPIDESIEVPIPSEQPIPGDDSGAAADCGSAVHDLTLPQSAADATATVRQQRQRINLKKEIPPNPPLGGGGQSEISDSKRASFERFAKTYPAPIVDYEKTLRLWAAMSDEDCENAIKGAKGYAAYLDELRAKKYSRNVKDAHRWLRGRQWIGFLGMAAAKTPAGSPIGTWIDVGSAEDVAWTVLWRICSQQQPGIVNGRRRVLAQWPPSCGDGLGPWCVVAEGTPQFAAWLRRVREGTRSTIGLRLLRMQDGKAIRGLKVPSEWPPAKGVCDGPEAEPSHKPIDHEAWGIIGE